MLNKVLIQGRCGNTPELKTTANGKEVATVSVAVTRNHKTDDGYITDWFTVVAWRNTANFLASHFVKGSQIIVDGTLQTRKYTDSEGKNRTVTEIVANEIHFCGSKNESASAPTTPAPNFEEIPDTEEDLPF